MAFQVDAPWIMKVFPIAHVAVGVGLTYYTVAGFVNSTVLRVSEGQLAVRQGPFPWPGNRTLHTSDLDQLCNSPGNQVLLKPTTFLLLLGLKSGTTRFIALLLGSFCFRQKHF